MTDGHAETSFEVEYLENGSTYESGYRYCTKKDTHTNYVLPNELSLGHLPDDVKDPLVLEFIRVQSQLTGMVEHKTTEGQDSYGSCIVQKIETVPGLIPASVCEDQRETVYKVTVSTACHVVPSDQTAGSCIVRLFYDKAQTDDGQKVLHGAERHTVEDIGDWCALVCITRDSDLVNLLRDLLKKYWNLGCELQQKYAKLKPNLVVIVSHPHGGPKLVSFGKLKLKTKSSQVRDGQEWCKYHYTTPTCNGSSGGPVYILGEWSEGFGYWFGHAHNHSRYERRGYDAYGESCVGVRLT